MINNQFSRRNLPSIVRMDLVLQRKSLEEERALQRMHHSCLNNDPRSPVTYSPEEKGKTLEILAKQADVSYGTTFQSGNFSIKKVYSQIIKFGRDSHNFHQSVFFQEFHEMR